MAGKYEKLKREMWVWRGKVTLVIGAGCSFEAGMPLSAELMPLVWRVLGEHPEVLSELHREFESSGLTEKAADDFTPKDAFPEELNPMKEQKCWQKIRENLKLRQKFMAGFTNLSNERAKYLPSLKPYMAIASLFEAGILSHVVCFNWDNLLERAYEHEFGKPIKKVIDEGKKSKHALWKCHGDVDDWGVSWVFPGEPGRVFSCLKECLKDTMVLVIIGYSERDKEVTDELIKPLEERASVWRVGPYVEEDEKNIRAEIPEVLRELAELAEPFDGFGRLTFAGEPNFAEIVYGHKLGPNNVEIAAKFADVAEIYEKLNKFYFVFVVGDYGQGKSITGFQVGYELLKEGFEVYLLKDRDIYKNKERCAELALQLESNQKPALFIIDDVHTVDESLVNLLYGLRNKNNCFLLMGSYPEEERRKAPLEFAQHWLVWDRVKAALVEYFGGKIVELCEQLKVDEWEIKRRIEAAKKANTAWQFSFILRRGWAEAKRDYEQLKANRYHFILLALSAYFMMTDERGVEFEALKKLFDQLEVKFGAKIQVKKGLDYLLKAKKVVKVEGFYGSLHHWHAMNFLLIAVRDENEKLPELRKGLLTLCISQTLPEYHYGTGWLILGLHRADERLASEVVRACKEALASSILQTSPQYHLGTGWLIYWLYKADEQLAGELVRACDKEALAKSISQTSPQYHFGTGRLISGLHRADEQLAGEILGLCELPEGLVKILTDLAIEVKGKG